MQRVESVEKLLLRLFLTGNEVYVIQEQYIGVSILGPEVLSGAGANGLNQIVGKISDVT